MNLLRRIFGRRTVGQYESIARGQRARDHLARKRERERGRLERARNEEEIRENRRQVFTVLAPILFFAAVVLGVVTAKPVTETLLLSTAPLERVAVQGATVLSPLAIAAGAGVLAGIPLDDVDPEAVRQALANEPWIESSKALRLPTGTLVLRIVEKQAVARWRVTESGAIQLVDDAGSRFAGAIEPGGPLPLVRGESEDLTGTLPGDALEILRALGRHASFAARPAALILHLPGFGQAHGGAFQGSPAGYVLELGHEGPRVILGRRLLTQRVARLAALLDEDKAMVRTAHLIDLRYADRAVLQTEPASG